MMENNEIIFNDGEISHEELIKYSRKSLYRNTLSFSIVGIIIFIIGFSLFITYFASGHDDTSLIVYSVGLMICALLMAGLPFLMALLLPKMMYKQNRSIIDGFKYHLEFGEKELNISLESPVAKTQTNINYLLVYKVRIYDDLVFVYLNSNVLYMFKLSGFSSRDEEIKAMKKIYIKYKVKE